ncbi:hypothetical protein EYF80_041149 [Liparis tanakae]|uniref:Uncharacterized protein n=1 Tax=Liparis tanakae TaxID=230148 RepID=A0A4Z2G510_9TELE|nr:hypothetical protein EYF80_041149 [Liparis tanakae]
MVLGPGSLPLLPASSPWYGSGSLPNGPASFSVPPCGNLDLWSMPTTNYSEIGEGSVGPRQRATRACACREHPAEHNHGAI